MQGLRVKRSQVKVTIEAKKRSRKKGPDSGTCELFDFKGAPDANTFQSMVSCFNPEQLERELS
ncbi:uncharacterized protein PHALS_13357 [Plasmopara halstedii]|uniref:Uncharacterized protein n=1 Tax=Plasmopara halstedii TaxID=4781 RepID=A0A0P1APB0_PLAHL|nr:uncharacterized protein PHALS_13357 [Plasmopara halstedii]CEG43141.1 hypothetical protein PHALS_13357 [Plasmopara halstedii]|eukprot:XP_024579510.1 hypothetical protein PHALS_13357 [Plasmopara halstedii]